MSNEDKQPERRDYDIRVRLLEADLQILQRDLDRIGSIVAPIGGQITLRELLIEKTSEVEDSCGHIESELSKRVNKVYNSLSERITKLETGEVTTRYLGGLAITLVGMVMAGLKLFWK